MNVQDIRNIFKQKLEKEDFVIDKTGVKTIEIVGSSFIADQPLIFGELNNDYIERELRWYISQSLFVKDIPGKTPKIWEDISSNNGKINSNYGWCIFSRENTYQYKSCLKQLFSHKDTRRAVMIYTRPEIQFDYNKNGMSDFICTNTVQYLIRDNYLHAVVNMRSNDIVFGYRNDFAWQDFVFNRLLKELNQKGNQEYKKGNIYWQTGSLHIYERHFNLIK